MDALPTFKPVLALFLKILLSESKICVCVCMCVCVCVCIHPQCIDNQLSKFLQLLCMTLAIDIMDRFS